jgi:hypothetical protein
MSKVDGLTMPEVDGFVMPGLLRFWYQFRKTSYAR